MTSYKKKQLKYSKCKYRGLHSFEGEGRRVGCSKQILPYANKRKF